MSTSGTSRSDLQAEHDFLAARLFDGDWRWVGLSSNAMVANVMLDRPLTAYPSDWADYDRCVETRARAPRHLHEAMDVWLSIFRQHVESRYPKEAHSVQS